MLVRDFSFWRRGKKRKKKNVIKMQRFAVRRSRSEKQSAAAAVAFVEATIQPSRHSQPIDEGNLICK